MIKKNAKTIDYLLRDLTMVRYIGEDGKEITSVEEASYRTHIFEAIGPYRQLYVFQIIRFFVEILCSLQYKIIKEYYYVIPYFSELFGIFYNEDKYIKSRKTWKMV